MSIHDLMIEQAHQAIEEYPADWAKIMKITRERLDADSAFRRDMQVFSDVPKHVRDLQAEWYYAVQCRTKVLMGDIVCCGVEIKSAPLADAQMEENDRLLQAGLRRPFRGNAVRGDSSDGWVEWKEPITVTRFVKQGRKIGSVLTKTAPWTACMEVGYTHGHRSYLHLWQESSLVRWCYDSTVLHVFKMTDEAIEEIHKSVTDQLSGVKAFKPVDLDAIKASVEQMTLWEN